MKEIRKGSNMSVYEFRKLISHREYKEWVRPEAGTIKGKVAIPERRGKNL